MKKYLIAAVAALTVFAGAAFAASLTVDAGTLQAGQDAIDKCIVEPDDVIEVTYDGPVFNESTNIWEVSTITLDDNDNCTGLAYSVVVTGTDTVNGTWATETQTGMFADDPAEATVTFDPAFDANEASDVHIAVRSTPPTP